MGMFQEDGSKSKEEVSKSKRKSNQNTKYIFKCDRCDKVFDSVIDLDGHFTTFHDTDRKIEEQLYNFNKLPAATVYKCLNCSFKTSESEKMISHHIDNH